MKKVLLSTLLIGLFSFTTFAQRFAYIDTDYIMENIPEYKAAQRQIEELSVQWQKEVEEKFSAIDKMYKDYQAEAVLLPDDVKRQRENQIIEAERVAKALQMQRFGREGDLFKKREELIKPIQDKIYEAVQEVATKGNYAIIFDKSSGATMIFTDVRFDLSDEVLQKMGYRK
ncbi:MAG: OmpH family outer membrane protein [Bacteroidetes bacterium]|nr:OmpH family outer membrane protein [Bacteroidota bacterium]